MTPRKSTALDVRMRDLEATAAEVGALIDRSPEEVEAMRKGDAEIDPATRVLLRTFLADDPQGARAALQRLRGRYVQNLQGDGFAYADLPPIPYGTGDVNKTTGGRPT
jgi:hypothetical protein